MRLLAGIFLIAVLSRTAHADVPPTSPLGLAIYFTGHGGAIDGVPEGGMGPTAELALGAGQAQYFVEAGAAWVSLGTEARATGVMARGGLGARWIARSFRAGPGAIEMTLVGLVGASKIWWDDGDALVRPELAFGVGFQVRRLWRRQAVIRFDLRAYFAPTDDDPMPVARCAGGCVAPPITNGGLMFSIGGGL